MIDIHVGTSGWHYAHWVGPFYPPKTRQDQFLARYAARFRTVEINASFYRLPSPETVQAWRQTAGPGFVFAVKAHRFITHQKKLKDPKQALAKFLVCIDDLGDALGPVLYQLPPRWRANLARLEAFLEALPAGQRAAFEFRDPSWFDDALFRVLARHRAALCISHLAGHTSPIELTGDFVYLRLHGPGEAYQGRYGRCGLAPWVKRIRVWRDEGREVFCYFDNDQAGYAPRDATDLLSLLGESGSGVPAPRTG